MFELTIATCVGQSLEIEEMKKLLEEDVVSCGGVILSHLLDGKANLTLAVPSSSKDFIKAKVIDLIADYIVSIYKYQYLRDNISFYFVNEQNIDTLIKALAEFDKSTDIDLIKKNIVFRDIILIDSIYYFKLGELKKRWKDIADLVSDNLPNLVAGDCIIDMLKFLIATTPPRTDEIYIINDDKNLILIKNNKLSHDRLFFDLRSKSLEQDLVTKLISLVYMPKLCTN